MAKQMEMFDDGGLMDEGGTVDPVSGNDVPPGSNQEEVRDDIPAQLSEGEFVFPADVVRYFGLEKLMEMRQEAKMGLQRMEDMGQMGNSEEAIMPDNLPFSIEDLDMEEDAEYNTSQEFAIGGMPNANSGVFYNPASQPTTGVAAAPVQAASASATPNIGQAATPVQAASAGQPTMFTNYQLPQAPVPVMTAPNQLPKFLGEVTSGVGGVDYTEETYVNESGQTVKFRRYNDGSLKDSSGNEAVIPEGYTIKSEADKKVTTDPTKVKTATVQDEGGSNEEDDREGLGPSGGTLSLGGTTVTSGPNKGNRTGVTQFGVSFDIPGQKFGGALQFAQNYSNLIAGTLPSNTLVTVQRYGLTSQLSYKDYLSLQNNPTSQKSQDIIGGFDLANLAGANQISINDDFDFVDKNGKAATYGVTVEAGKAIVNSIQATNIFGTNIGSTFNEKYDKLNTTEQQLVDDYFEDLEDKEQGDDAKKASNDAKAKAAFEIYQAQINAAQAKAEAKAAQKAKNVIQQQMQDAFNNNDGQSADDGAGADVGTGGEEDTTTDTDTPGGGGFTGGTDPDADGGDMN